MKKLSVSLIRYWITLSFLFIFGIGWITLSHSEKPAALSLFQKNIIVSGVEFTSVPNLEELTVNNRRTASSPIIGFSRSIPRLRTMGS